MILFYYLIFCIISLIVKVFEKVHIVQKQFNNYNLGGNDYAFKLCTYVKAFIIQ